MAAIVRYMQEEYFPRQKEALAEFSASAGIAVKGDFLPVDPFWHDARAAFGLHPTWDLLVPDEVIVAEQMAGERLEPLGARAERDGLDLSDWLPAGIDAFLASGELYAIPYVAMSNVLIYRRDLLDRYDISVPATWDELRDAALSVQAALRRHGQEQICGFTSRGLAGYGHNFWIIGSTLFPSWGWQRNRGRGQPPLVDTPEMVDALDFYAALLQEAGPPEAAGMTFTDTHGHYAGGKAVFLLDAATELATMRRESDASVGNQSGIAVVPAGPSGRPEPGLYSPAYCIPRSSPVVEEAWRLLMHLVSVPELRKDAIDAGYAEPARESVVESDIYVATYDADFRETLEETRKLARINRPLIPFGFDLGDIVGAAAERVIAGRESAVRALRDAQSQVDSIKWSL
jgi:ABC-type glycerol-3-phosphate transport system substrate-binding protein